MSEVSSPTLQEATGCVEVDPQKEPDVGPLAVEAHVFIVEGVNQLFHSEDRLAD